MSDPPRSDVLNTVTNTNLLEGLKDRDNRTIWTAFVERYRPMIETYARRFGLHEADAQDAAQHTMIAFCTAYQDGKYDREKGRLRIWLFGIARNQILNLRKKKKHREVQPAAQTSSADFFADLEDENQMEQVWEQEWRDAVLRQCLEEVRREFDPKSIDAFELFAWKGLPAQQVADQLGMTPNAVFVVKHRIMKRIRELVPRMEEIW